MLDAMWMTYVEKRPAYSEAAPQSDNTDETTGKS
jgi:hypothetical protein